MSTKEYLVSAIVSTYKAEKFIRGLLEDLERQTIADELEIIVIDSGSPENEGEIVKEFQQKYDNIVYERTERETVYAAWNRAIKLARGKYITNANTDDRRREDAYEVMAEELEDNPDVGIVYSDVIITEKENETFENNSSNGLFKFEEPDRNLFAKGYCFIGPMPMWRKSIHAKAGYFEPDFVTSGDLEMWLRLSRHYRMKKINQVLGLYQKRDDSVENSNGLQKHIENSLIRFWYNPYRENNVLDWDMSRAKEMNKNFESITKLINEGSLKKAEEQTREILNELPNDHEALYFLATIASRNGDDVTALEYYNKVLKIDNQNSLVLNNLSVLNWRKGKHDLAIHQLKQVVELDKENEKALENLIDMLEEKHRYSEAEVYAIKLINRNIANKKAIQILKKYYEKKDQVQFEYYSILERSDNLKKWKILDL